MRGARKNSWLATIVLLALCTGQGCVAGGDWEYLVWWKDKKVKAPVGPLVESPIERSKKLKELAENAPKMSPAEQEKAVEDLVLQLQKEEIAHMRIRLLQTLGAFSQPAATAMLNAGLKDSDRDVRIICCETVGKHKPPDAANKLMEVLSSDTEIDVRMAAARALGEFKDDQAVVAALGTALDSNDPALQYRAVQSLRKTTGKPYDDNVNTWREYVKGNNPPEPSIAARVKSWF
jgi:HEAT repeat protein